MKQRGIATDAVNVCRTKVGEKAKGGTTSVVTERVRKLLIIEGIAGCRDAKECAT